MKINIQPSNQGIRDDRIKTNPKAVILKGDSKDSFDSLINGCTTIEDIKDILKAFALLIY